MLTKVDGPTDQRTDGPTDGTTTRLLELLRAAKKCVRVEYK